MRDHMLNAVFLGWNIGSKLEKLLRFMKREDEITVITVIPPTNRELISYLSDIFTKNV